MLTLPCDILLLLTKVPSVNIQEDIYNIVVYIMHIYRLKNWNGTEIFIDN